MFVYESPPTSPECDPFPLSVGAPPIFPPAPIDLYGHFLRCVEGDVADLQAPIDPARVSSAILKAAAAGKVDALQWALDQKFKLDSEVYISAAMFGKIKVLEWAHQVKIPFHPDTCLRAIQTSNVDFLERAIELGAPHDVIAVENAREIQRHLTKYRG